MLKKLNLSKEHKEKNIQLLLYLIQPLKKMIYIIFIWMEFN